MLASLLPTSHPQTRPKRRRSLVILQLAALAGLLLLYLALIPLSTRAGEPTFEAKVKFGSDSDITYSFHNRPIFSRHGQLKGKLLPFWRHFAPGFAHDVDNFAGFFFGKIRKLGLQKDETECRTRSVSNRAYNTGNAPT
jgi:hypothetical protein